MRKPKHLSKRSSENPINGQWGQYGKCFWVIRLQTTGLVGSARCPVIGSVGGRSSLESSGFLIPGPPIGNKTPNGIPNTSLLWNQVSDIHFFVTGSVSLSFCRCKCAAVLAICVSLCCLSLWFGVCLKG